MLCAVALAIPTVGADVDAVRLTDGSAFLKTENGKEKRELVSLPLRWDKVFPDKGGYAKVEVPIPPEYRGERFGLYFRRLGNQAVVRINDTVVLELGRLGDPGTNHSRAPILVEIPKTVIDDVDAPVLVIEITAQPGRWGGIAAPILGALADVSVQYQSRYLWRQTSSTVILFALVAMGLLALWLFVRQREQVFALFALLAASGSAKVVDRLLTVDPVPWPFWGAFASTGYAVHVICIVIFALLVAGIQIRRLWFVVTVSSVFVGTLTTIAFVFTVPELWTLTLASLFIPAVAAWIAVLRKVFRTGSKEAWIILISGSLVVVAGARDFFFLRLPTAGFETFAVMPIALFLLVVLMAWVIVDRFSLAVSSERELSSTLSDRIEQKEIELKESYSQLAEQGKRQATFEERQRIMRDIHDGVGAHLVSLLNLTQRHDGVDARIARESQMALDELRMAIDSLSPVEDDLSLVLATLRYRMLPRLKENGLSISWDVDALQPLPNLTPSAILNIQRILLEAFTNIIRHSGATRVTVKAAPAGTGIVKISVTDNGSGINDLSGEGKGLENMKVRAKAIGALLSIAAVESGGTRISLELKSESV